MIKKLCDLKMQSFFKSNTLEQNLYDLSSIDTLLFIFSYHNIGPMREEHICIKTLLKKIQPILSEPPKNFESEIFTEIVLAYVNKNQIEVFNYITSFIKDFEEICKPVTLDSLPKGVSVGQYARTTKKNFGFIH
jgi:hypothetical protein